MNTLSTDTVRPRRAARRPWLAVALGIVFLALPTSAGAYYYGSSGETSATPAVEKQSSDSGLVAPDHTALNESLAPLSGSQNPGGTGNTPTTIVYDSPSAGDGFDWADAALGAGLAMALITIGGAAVITVRRRTGASPAASTS
jgi:hypothetical protein